MNRAEPVQEEEQAAKPVVGKTLVCRLCKGGHFTAKCPYKDQLAAIDQVDLGEGEAESGPQAGSLAARGTSAAGAPTGRYIPPYVISSISPKISL